MFSSGKKTIGLDIGSSSIKIAEVEVSKKGVELVSFGLISTPPNSVSGGDITDIATLGGSIQALLNEIKSKRKVLSVGLWGTAVIIKKITIPTVDKKLLREQIRFEAEQYIPFDINQITLAHHILGTNTSSDTMDVLLIAAQNEIVIQNHQLSELTGMKSSIIDVSGFALANCFEANYGVFNTENIGIINIGASVTNFVVVSNGEVIFCRDVPVGGSNYTNEIHKSMGLSLQESEAMKISAFSNQEVPDEVHSIISASNEAVIDELRNTLDFFSATNNGVQLNRFFYSGGASGTTGLIDGIQKNLQVQCEQLNAFAQVKANGKKFPYSYLDQINLFSPVAIGLATRMVGDHD